VGLKTMLWVCGIILPFSFHFFSSVHHKSKKAKERGKGGQRKFVSLVFREEQEEEDGKKKQKQQKEEEKEEEEEEEEEREKREKTTKQ